VRIGWRGLGAEVGGDLSRGGGGGGGWGGKGNAGMFPRMKVFWRRGDMGVECVSARGGIDTYSVLLRNMAVDEVERKLSPLKLPASLAISPFRVLTLERILVFSRPSPSRRLARPQPKPLRSPGAPPPPSLPPTLRKELNPPVPQAIDHIRRVHTPTCNLPFPFPFPLALPLPALCFGPMTRHGTTRTETTN